MPTGAARFPLLIFCQQLLSLLEAGLQLVEAVATLTEKEQDSRQHAVLAQLQASLQSGMSFSQTLAQWPQIFPPLFQAAIEASEQTGGVAQALKRFVAYETQFQTLRSRLVGALIYPALLLSLGGLVVAFLLGYVVPRFSVVFIDRLESMPYLSRLVIRLGLAISDNPLTALLLTGVVLGTGLTLLLHPAMRSWLTGMAWQLPWLGQRIHQFELVRLYRALGMLLRGGIPAVRSLQMIASMAPLRSRQGIDRVIATVSEGQPISMALQREGFTTVVSDRLLAVGERSGQMGDMLERAADFMDAELERAVDRATRLMEPLMMIVIGVLIGGIVMLMYLPIFELADSVG
ncbi:MAG: type II secretion system F family protein [Rhodoferax sp.]|nr:type II secretion system F family protein [Rhodoferax sp.]